MDTSTLYIEQCRKATKIQADWKSQDGDVVFINVTIKGEPRYVGLGICLEDGRFLDRDALGLAVLAADHVFYFGFPAIWLPRQDQLQKMYPFSECYTQLMHLWNFTNGLRVGREPDEGEL